MEMELKHLRYFIAVAEEGHITRAAQRLGIQQPPLSRQIKAIEREIDVQLFRRKARGVELTEAGQAFLDEARAMFSHLDHALDTVRRTARGEEGQICLGYTGAAAFHPLVPRVIRNSRQAFPSVSLILEEGPPYDLIERMQDDEIDVAFIGGPVASQEGVAVDALLNEQMMVALPAEHPLAQTERALTLKSLADDLFILFGRPRFPLNLQTDAVIAACQSAGFSPRVGYVVPNNISRLNLVAAGLGIAIIAASLQRMNVEGVVYRRLKRAKSLKIPLSLAWVATTRPRWSCNSSSWRGKWQKLSRDFIS
jgi:DNA-binding transcriptional LysR family regulator